MPADANVQPGSADPVGLAVEARGLTKIFRDFWRRPRVSAVVDLDLRVERGEVFGLLGPNGSGKSTTIKMMLGLLHPSRGLVRVLGEPPESLAARAQIGFLPEESYLYGFLSAEESLDHYGRLFGISSRTRRQRTGELLAMVGLEAERKRPLSTLSKGMRRRVGLCQALVNDPALVVLDEPTSGLDPIGARRVKDLIEELRRQGRTVLLTSHLLADVADVCDRLAILYGGRTRVEGRVQELLEEPGATRIDMGEVPADVQARLSAWLAEQGVEVRAIGAPQRSLESVFLDVVRSAESERVPSGGAASGGPVPAFLASRAAPTGGAPTTAASPSAPPPPPPGSSDAAGAPRDPL